MFSEKATKNWQNLHRQFDCRMDYNELAKKSCYDKLTLAGMGVEISSELITYINTKP